MSEFSIKPIIDKDSILNTVTQEEIFEHYLGVPIEFKKHFCSPLRKDKHPTCSFKRINGILFFRDWTEDKPKTCFGLVMEMYSLTFHEALDQIYYDMIQYKRKYRPIHIRQERQYQPVKSKKTKIQVKVVPHFKHNVLYMSSFGITKQTMKKFNCYSVSRVWVNDRLTWSDNHLDPCIAYYFGKTDEGEQRWKIYFYKRKTYRFIGNTNRINGHIQLPEHGDTLVITKSMKDVMALHSLGVSAIAMQNEVTIPYEEIINELGSRFNRIVSFYDFDHTGVVNANKLKRLYNIPYVFLTNGKYGTKNYGSKDISDYIRSNGTQDAREFLKNSGIIKSNQAISC